MTRKEKRVSLLNDDWWLDLLEGELDPSFSQDLELLLQNSEVDREIYEALAVVRKLVESSEDTAMPEDGRYYDRLHEKIMTATFDGGDAKRKTAKETPGLLGRDARFTLEAVVSAITKNLSTNEEPVRT